MVDRIGSYVHTYTLYNEYRPFGCSVIAASYDEFDGYSLYMVDPSGQALVTEFVLYKLNRDTMLLLTERVKTASRDIWIKLNSRT